VYEIAAPLPPPPRSETVTTAPGASFGKMPRSFSIVASVALRWFLSSQTL
jgi:hypothetical protein